MKIEIYDGKAVKQDTFSNIEINDSVKSIWFETLNNITKSSFAKKDYKVLLDFLINRIMSESRSQFASFSCVRSSGDESAKDIAKNASMKCVSYSSLSDAPIKIVEIKTLHGLFARAITHSMIVISNDTTTDPRSLHPALPENHPVITCFLALPLYYKGEIIGQLSIGNKRGGYGQNDIILLQPLFEICGILLYKKIKHASKKDSVATKERGLQKKRKSVLLKDQFLATMSHELRTPLNGIVGMVSMMKDAGPLNKKQEEYIGILMDCSHRLLSLMNNILDFTKMASNRLALLHTSISLKEIVKNTLGMVEGSAKTKNLQLVSSVPDNLPAVLGDSQRLTQILSNLLVNAIKFTEKGAISISVHAVKIDGNTSLLDSIDTPVIPEEHVKDANKIKSILCVDLSDDKVCRRDEQKVKFADDKISTYKWKVTFEVKDTGIGIPLEEQEKIFEVFHQSPTLNTNMSRTGTGLGLSIARELTRLMGGKIKVFSEGLGKGTTFSFFVVLDEELDLGGLKESSQKLLSRAPILVVDDRLEMRLQISDLLFRWGCEPFLTSSGEEALRYIENERNFACVIVDICMPYMSGIELAQELRRKRPTLPLIAISSIEVKSGKELFDTYLDKPIDQNKLFPALLDCIKYSASLSPTPATSLAFTPSNTTISFSSQSPQTVIHQSLPLSTMLTRIDSNIGYADSGRQSIANSNNSSEKTHPSTISYGKRRTPKPDNKAISSVKILVAEDDKYNAYTLREMLLHLGYSSENIKIVENGEQCVREAKRENYDVILMDLIMPVMDGIEATKYIRQQRNRPYIIAVSASVQNSDKQRCQDIGVDCYLTKPITKESLLAVLSR